MSVPAGNRPPVAVLSSVTRSASSRSTWKTLDRRPIARILFLIARRLNSGSVFSCTGTGGDTGPDDKGVSSSSSSLEQVLRMAMSMSVIFSPTKGRDQVKTSMKFGNQYG